MNNSTILARFQALDRAIHGLLCEINLLHQMLEEADRGRLTTIENRLTLIENRLALMSLKGLKP